MRNKLYFILILFMFWSIASNASWQDLWWRKDQQGMALLKQGKNEQAANTFESHSWKAVANYRAKKYGAAEKDFSKQAGSIGKYNLGNALALEGKYQAAIDSYDQAIKQQPKFEDAIYNREIVKKLMEQQKKSQSSPDNKKQKENQQQKSNSTEKNQQKPDQSQQNNEQNQNSSFGEKSQDQKNKQGDEHQNKGNNENSQKQSEQNNKQQEKPAQQNPNPDNKQNSSPEHQKQQTQTANRGEKQQTNVNDTESAKNNSTSAGNQQHPAQNTSSSGNSKNAANTEKQLSRKQLDQESDQWLQQIPDDPGELLRRKIMRDHLKKMNHLEES